MKPFIFYYERNWSDIYLTFEQYDIIFFGAKLEYTFSTFQECLSNIVGISLTLQHRKTAVKYYEKFTQILLCYVYVLTILLILQSTVIHSKSIIHILLYKILFSNLITT